MKVEVLGPGCKRCEQLYENTLIATADFDSPSGIEVIKVKDIKYFARMGVFVTPGLVIDGDVVSAAKVLSVDEIKNIIAERL